MAILDLLEKFVAWRNGDKGVRSADLFAPGFVCWPETDVWVHTIDALAEEGPLEVLALIADEEHNSGLVVFVVHDEITLLDHHVTYLAAIRSGKFIKLTESSKIVSWPWPK